MAAAASAAETFLIAHWSEFCVGSERDAIIACLHALLLSEQFKLDGQEAGVLPAGWNSSQELYTINYLRGGRKYVVKGLAMDDQLLVNVLSSVDNEVHACSVNTKEHVNSDCLQSYPSVFKQFSQLCFLFRQEVIDKFKEPQPHASVTAAGTRVVPLTRPHVTPNPDPLMVGGPRVPHHRDDPLREPNPFSVGEGDRLPFGLGGSGGMLMDPFRQGGMPGMPRLPQGVPPGARFDPFTPFHPPRGPLPPGPRSYGPDNDHLPPPGYDDMFM